jgi:peptidoglycan-N-acetylglucosamine deacetylase
MRASVRQRALAYSKLSQQLQGRDILHVLLLHHKLINALWVADVIAQFKDMGWPHHHAGRRIFRSRVPVDPRTPRPRAKPAALHGPSFGIGKSGGWERLVDDGVAILRLQR